MNEITTISELSQDEQRFVLPIFVKIFLGHRNGAHRNRLRNMHTVLRLMTSGTRL